MLMIDDDDDNDDDDDAENEEASKKSPSLVIRERFESLCYSVYLVLKLTIDIYF